MQQQQSSSFILGHYLVTPEKLGSGGTSEVFLGYDLENNKPVAVKRLTPPVESNGTRNRDWDREVRALNVLRGESNVLRLLDVFTANSNAQGGFSSASANSHMHPGHHHHGAAVHHAHRNSYNQDVNMSGASSSASYVYQIYDVVDGKDLLELFNSNPSALTENLIRYVFYQVVEVLHRVHQRGVVHLDIKPENVMFDTSKGQIVLIDFGFSEMFDMHDPISVSKKSGSIEYCAPEIYFESLYDGRFADVWSLGVLLYVLLFRRFPFNIKVDKGVKMSRGDYLQAMFEEKVTGSLLFPDKTASSLRSLLCGMLAPNPEDRLSTGEILSHEWLLPLKNAHHTHQQQQTLHVNFKHNSKFAHTLGHYVNVAMQVSQSHNTVQQSVAVSSNLPTLSVATQATPTVAAVAP